MHGRGRPDGTGRPDPVCSAYFLPAFFQRTSFGSYTIGFR
jgi:hypothetical protein